MKQKVILTVMSIFLYTISHNLTAQSEKGLNALLKSTQSSIQVAYGEHELKYNKQIRKFFSYGKRLNSEYNASVNISDMMLLSKDLLSDYKEANNNCYEMMHLCSAAYGMHGLLGSYRDQFVQIVRLIDQSLLYWYEQAHHPVHYFLHKSPIKWFGKEKQCVEIKKKIVLLQFYKEHFCTILGLFALHIKAFDADQKNNEILSWVEQGVALLDVVKNKNELLGQQEHVDDIHYFIKKNFKKSQAYSARIKKKLYRQGLLIPSHVERYWILYSSAALAVAVASWYIATHHEKMVQAQKALSIMRSEMYGDLKRPLIGFQEAFLQDSHAKKINVQKVWENLKEETAVFVDRAMEFFPENEFDEQSRERIKNNLMKLKTVDISDRYLSKMKGSKWGKLWNAPDIGAGIIYEVNGLKLSMLGMINEVYDELFKNVRGNKFTIAVASSVPLYGIFIGLCAGLNKVYSLLFYRWFNALALNTTLKKINDILVDGYYVEEVAPLMYGNLIYLLTILRAQVHCITKHQKADFLNDCERLASVNMTVRQKIEIITNMRAYYTHLC